MVWNNNKTVKIPPKTGKKTHKIPTLLFCICDKVVLFCQNAYLEMCFNNISVYYM